MAKILLTEDNAFVRDVIQHSLTNAGHEVLLAENGKSAINLLKQDPVDVLVTDIFMPEVDGVELIKSIRDGGSNMKIIAISGGGESQMPQFATTLADKMGANAVLTKPFGSRDLLDIIEVLIEEQEQEVQRQDG